jgi:hypothetical protein
MRPDCGFVRANRIADDPVQGDDIDAVIALMPGPGWNRTGRARRSGPGRPRRAGLIPAGRVRE